MRKHLAALPIADKLRLVETMQENLRGNLRGDLMGRYVLPEADRKIIKKMRRSLHKECNTLMICSAIAEQISDQLNYPAQEGYFRGMWHCWNVLPDGNILDASADQFKLEGIRIVDKDSNEFKDYAMTHYITRMGTLSRMIGAI